MCQTRRVFKYLLVVLVLESVLFAETFGMAVPVWVGKPFGDLAQIEGIDLVFEVGDVEVFPPGVAAVPKDRYMSESRQTDALHAPRGIIVSENLHVIMRAKHCGGGVKSRTDSGASP